LTVSASLFTSYYPEKNAVRRQEIDDCLRRNAECALLQRICLFVEGGATLPVVSPKIQVRPISNRPTYSDFFGWINEISGPDETAIVANSDICFDRSVVALLWTLDSNACAALSRWDVLPDGCGRLFDRADSQDVWVFRGPVRPVVGNFPVGVPRCDNRILYELRAAGYRVVNPAFSVRTLHLHSGERSEYPAIIQGLHVPPPYNYLWPHNLLSLPATIWWNLRHPTARIRWRVDQRAFESTLPVRIVRRLLRSCYPSSADER